MLPPPESVGESFSVWGCGRTNIELFGGIDGSTDYFVDPPIEMELQQGEVHGIVSKWRKTFSHEFSLLTLFSWIVATIRGITQIVGIVKN